MPNKDLRQRHQAHMTTASRAIPPTVLARADEAIK
jgi:hypothetical protein